MSKRVRTEQEARAARIEAGQLHEAGIDIPEIARRLKTYGRVVKFWIGIDDSQWDFDSIMALRNRGQTNTEISNQVGVPREYVWHTLGTQSRRSDTVVRQVRMKRSTWDRLPHLCDELGVRKLSANVKPSNSVARLLDAIAGGHIEVRWKPGATPDNVNLNLD